MKIHKKIAEIFDFQNRQNDFWNFVPIHALPQRFTKEIKHKLGDIALCGETAREIIGFWHENHFVDFENQISQ